MIDQTTFYETMHISDVVSIPVYLSLLEYVSKRNISISESFDILISLGLLTEKGVFK